MVGHGRGPSPLEATRHRIGDASHPGPPRGRKGNYGPSPAGPGGPWRWDRPEVRPLLKGIPSLIRYPRTSGATPPMSTGSDVREAHAALAKLALDNPHCHQSPGLLMTPDTPVREA